MLKAIFNGERADSSHVLLSAYERLQGLNPNWIVEFGPRDSDRWITGSSFHEAERGPFGMLLARIQDRMQTADRKVIAASFALRFGWSSAVAFAPYFSDNIIPDVRLANISLRFSEGTLFERVSLHEPRVFVGPDRETAALEPLRAVLVEQATPMVDALFRWSKLPRRALWGQVASSWGAQFELILSALGRADEALPQAGAFFEAAGPAFDARPKLYVVEHCDLKRVHQCRASCCLYYKVKEAGFCASCPLITQEERVSRNRAWIERTIASPA